MLTKDYEMLFLELKEEQYLAWLENQHRYEIFELPFLTKQILTKIQEVQDDTSSELPDLRETESDDISSRSTKEIF